MYTLAPTIMWDEVTGLWIQQPAKAKRCLDRQGVHNVIRHSRAIRYAAGPLADNILA